MAIVADISARYINKGNSKFGAVTIETHEGGVQSSLKYRLFVDGKEAWNTVVLSSPPVEQDKGFGSIWDSFKLG
jgi:alkaline phosphatase D